MLKHINDQRLIPENESKCANFCFELFSLVSKVSQVIGNQ